MLAGIEGARVVEVLSSVGLPDRSAEVTSASLFISPGPRPIKLVQSGRPLSPVPVLQPLMGDLSLDVVQAWDELEAWYGIWPLTGEQGFFPTTGASVSSGQLAPDEAFYDLEIPEGNYTALAGRSRGGNVSKMFFLPHEREGIRRQLVPVTGAKAPADNNGQFFSCSYGGGRSPHFPRVEEQGKVFQ